VSLTEVWTCVIDRAVSGPFGDSGDIMRRRRGVELFAARLAGEDRRGWAREQTAQETWWRAAVAEWRRSGVAQTLRDCVAAQEFQGDVDGTVEPSCYRLPWLWNESEADPRFVEVFGRAIERTFEFDLTGGWRGGPVSAGEADVGESLRDIVARSWRELDDRVPHLLASLGGHISCIAWMDLHVADTTFRSGTTPDLPGVVLLSSGEAGTDSYVSRALVHEAAHCKFFDLCVSRDIVGGPYHNDEATPPFTVSVPWIAATSRRSDRWPLDQVLAAAHAYLHLALLGGACWMGDCDGDVSQSTWTTVLEESLDRLAVLLAGLSDASVTSFGLDGVEFVGWMRGILRLAGAVDEVAKSWEGAGPVVRVASGLETLQDPSWGAGLIGRVGAGDVLWASAMTVELVRRGAGCTVGDLAVARLRQSAESPAEALVQTVDSLTSLVDTGVVTLV
jgi:hypothetical protein